MLSWQRRGANEVRSRLLIRPPLGGRCLKGFPDGLVFVIDEISVDSGDGRVGCYWHCETPDGEAHGNSAAFVCMRMTWGKRAGKAFPFSRGLSFYKVDAAGKLVFAREIPEPFSPAATSSPFVIDRPRAMQFVPGRCVTPELLEATAQVCKTG